MIDILVRPRGVHGIPAAEYADAISKRLPERTVQYAATPAEETTLLPDARVVTGVTMSPAALERASQLELFAGLFAGTDHLPMAAFREHDVTVTNASGVHGPNIAEFVIGGLLAHIHRFETGRRRQDAHQWQSYPTNELAGDTVTIVGLGAIGQAIVERLAPFDVTTIGVRHTPEKGATTDEVLGYDEDPLLEAVARTDHLILACPLTETTEGLVDKQVLETLPPTATVTNIARGPVIETDALVSALRRNHIGGAILDVTDPEPLPADHPLWNFDAVRITPHNAGYTPAYYDRLADILAENVSRLETDEPLRNVVS